MKIKNYTNVEKNRNSLQIKILEVNKKNYKQIFQLTEKEKRYKKSSGTKKLI